MQLPVQLQLLSKYRVLSVTQLWVCPGCQWHTNVVQVQVLVTPRAVPCGRLENSCSYSWSLCAAGVAKVWRHQEASWQAGGTPIQVEVQEEPMMKAL